LEDLLVQCHQAEACIVVVARAVAVVCIVEASAEAVVIAVAVVIAEAAVTVVEAVTAEEEDVSLPFFIMLTSEGNPVKLSPCVASALFLSTSV
jgi:hypothetical protein